MTTPSPTTPDTPNTLRELSPAACWLLLETHDLGRLAYVDRDGPAIVPLNYVAEHGTLWFATASYDQLAVHVAGQAVAFEIDAGDHANHSGWSVLVRGLAVHVLPGVPGVELPATRPQPWADGTRSMIIRLEPTQVSGRSLHP